MIDGDTRLELLTKLETELTAHIKTTEKLIYAMELLKRLASVNMPSFKEHIVEADLERLR